jgi:AcrR family transcriptional regulator
VSTPASQLTRGARKAQTREAIVGAATRLFAEHGIEATSLDRIAGEVGLTKGAIYSTFASKDELVEAVGVATSVTIPPDVLLDPDVPLKDGLRKLASDLMAARKRIVHEVVLIDLELFLYERRHPTLGDRVLQEQKAEFSRFAQQLQAAVDARGEQLPAPSEEFCHAIQALARGIVQELERDPKTFTTEAVVALFAALAD